MLLADERGWTPEPVSAGTGQGSRPGAASAESLRRTAGVLPAAVPAVLGQSDPARLGGE